VNGAVRIIVSAATLFAIVVKPFTKTDLPVSQIRRYLEPGPIVLVSSALTDTVVGIGNTTGDGVFMVSGKVISRRAQFRPELL